jgi:hypothetical protein
LTRIYNEADVSDVTQIVDYRIPFGPPGLIYLVTSGVDYYLLRQRQLTFFPDIVSISIRDSRITPR